ncbi:protein NUCLEAR FUSION DEFECTIVE 4-like [Prunus yedoensis var. nudiflora]|uniref:Protein NUCLEAR FUSION DEFECTIVE 4-like n=1 Tax=Prunus yedoensis var. nudiflora TaxID=2094558 RepID=A0A314UH30_PRUYE|nr:protein NUCLEAR FUSION DEFECTIVE 4-like [Prunus yedoensis var. nudiflora]
MVRFHGKLKALFNSRWLVFVCAMWIQSFAGIGYLFGSISPVIKSTMGYNQRQLAILGVAKDWGDAVGFVAGSLSEVLPTWGLLSIGAALNFLGYGFLWLIVSQRLPAFPLWVLCICIYVGTNGETFFNTAALISCVQNFPKSRGPVVGILKGYAGLSGAIITQIYAMINSPNESSLLFMIAVGPSMVVIALMFIVRPVGGHRQVRPEDNSSFLFTYSVCLVLAAYLLGVLILEDLLNLSQSLITLFAVILIILILLPIIIPIILVFFFEPTPSAQESLLLEAQREEDGKSEQDKTEVILSEVEDEKSPEVDSLPASERQKRIAQLQAKLFQAAADGAVRIKRRKGPRRGEDFTLMQALIKADFWLIFVSLLLAAGSGLTLIDNLGQIALSLGYTDSSIYVSMISIWNFLGRVGGGYFSEIIVRDFAYPRPVAMAVVQVIMAIGLFYYAVGLPGQIYVTTVLVGLGYGAHWAILPAAASELFGLKNFGALYNFLTMANPAGSLIFSEVIASGIYDHYAKEQAALRHRDSASMLIKPLRDDDSLSCVGTVCYSITCGILSGLCIVAAALSLIVVYRTRRVYTQLYGSRG